MTLMFDEITFEKQLSNFYIIMLSISVMKCTIEGQNSFALISNYNPIHNCFQPSNNWQLI